LFVVIVLAAAYLAGGRAMSDLISLIR